MMNKKMVLPKIFSPEIEQILYTAEAERNLVAAVLVDGKNFEYANLSSSDFLNPRLRRFWKTFEAIHAAGKPIDRTTVLMELVRRGDPQETEVWLSEIEFYIAQLMRVRENAGMAYEMAERRRMVQRSRKLYLRAQDTDTPLPEERPG